MKTLTSVWLVSMLCTCVEYTMTTVTTTKDFNFNRSDSKHINMSVFCEDELSHLLGERTNTTPVTVSDTVGDRQNNISGVLSVGGNHAPSPDVSSDLDADYDSRPCVLQVIGNRSRTPRVQANTPVESGAALCSTTCVSADQSQTDQRETASNFSADLGAIDDLQHDDFIQPRLSEGSSVAPDTRKTLNIIGLFDMTGRCRSSVLARNCLILVTDMEAARWLLVILLTFSVSCSFKKSLNAPPPTPSTKTTLFVNIQNKMQLYFIVKL